MIPYRWQVWFVDQIERIRRGYGRMWTYIRRWSGSYERGARKYRFEGEQANLASQLAETRASIAHFEAEAATPDLSPERRHWLNHHKVGMENRLAILEIKPRLTVEELHERDAIETHLYGAPLKRGRTATIQPLLGGAPGLVGAFAGVRLWMVFGGLAAVTGLWAGVQGHRIDRLKDDVAEAEAAASRNFAAAQQWRAEYEAAHAQVIEASQLAAQTAENLEAERRRAAVARRRQQERERAIQDVLIRDTPPPWDSLLRNAEPTEGSPGAGSDSPPAGNPG